MTLYLVFFSCLATVAIATWKKYELVIRFPIVMYSHFYINKYIFTPLAFVLLFVMSRHTNCLVYLYIYIYIDVQALIIK